MSGLAAVLATQPQLQAVATAAQAFGLPPRVLLHAGPPLADPLSPPPVLWSSALLTCVHEGWAPDLDGAEALLRSGAVAWQPAQAWGCVVPLAFVVSAGTPLFEVGDGAGARMHAPVSAVRGPDTRMGSRDLAVLPRLARRDACIAPAWQTALAARGPLPLLPLAALGLAGGDDLHSRTAAANAELTAWLRQAGEGAVADDVAATPLFFLTLWMAASALMLRAAELAPDARSLVTRAGGNGQQFGIALAGAPEDWCVVAAEPPAGKRLAGAPEALVCGAIGDSAVIDLYGCGGQALAGAAEPLLAFEGFVPADHARLAGRLMAAPHPVLRRPVALDASRVCAAGLTPLVALAMIAADGRAGFAGRGLYRPPLDLFERALAALG